MNESSKTNQYFKLANQYLIYLGNPKKEEEYFNLLEELWDSMTFEEQSFVRSEANYIQTFHQNG